MNRDEFDKLISDLLIRWNDLKKELTEQFEKRDRKQTLVPMQEGIVLFQKFLLYSNEFEGEFEEISNTELKLTPVNLIERFTFIKNRPDFYHSFKQLVELFNEQEKQYKKNLAIIKVTRH